MLAHFPGAALAGHPLRAAVRLHHATTGRAATRSCSADFVTTEDGTGLVHTALAFGEDDFRLGEQYGITLQNPVRPDGTFDERVTDFAGPVRQGRRPGDRRGAARRAAGCCAREVYEHAYPHCWRCGTPLLYYAKSSWYVAHHRASATGCSRRTRASAGTPSTSSTAASASGSRATSTGRSRASATGARRCRSGSAAEPTASERFCAGSIAELRERGGEVPDDLHRPYIDEVVAALRVVRRRDAPGRGGDRRLVRLGLDAVRAVPLPVRERGGVRRSASRPTTSARRQDQTRGWFYSLLASRRCSSTATSYRNCVCLGLILDPEGQKMSKSRGNVVDPWEVLDRHGADAFRWYYLTSQQPWAGYRFSAETVGESVRQFLLTLWNTYSFFVLYANAEELGPDDCRSTPPLARARTSTGGRCRACRGLIAHGDRAHGRLRLHHRRAGDRRLRRRALELVRAALAAALLGRRPRPRSRPCATA